MICTSWEAGEISATGATLASELAFELSIRLRGRSCWPLEEMSTCLSLLTSGAILDLPSPSSAPPGGAACSASVLTIVSRWVRLSNFGIDLMSLALISEVLIEGGRRYSGRPGFFNGLKLGSRPWSSSHLLRAEELKRFFTAFSVRPGSILAISLHRLPKNAWPSKTTLSSSAVQSPFLMLGSRWLCHRSRHCLPIRPGNRAAMEDHLTLPAPYLFTISKTTSSSSFVQGPLCSPGFSTLFQRWRHCTSVRLPSNSETFFQFFAPYCFTICSSLASSSGVHFPPIGPCRCTFTRDLPIFFSLSCTSFNLASQSIPAIIRKKISPVSDTIFQHKSKVNKKHTHKFTRKKEETHKRAHTHKQL
mmetsp:Transcript_11694/g.17968  ORF Transcript_11694/g.17968 Transcript_11694/m.17968 type:complete len:361 (-) Transcript_11694:33-1115(-)